MTYLTVCVCMCGCICAGTRGDAGTLSLGELFDESPSVGRPNLLLKKGKSGVSGEGGTEKGGHIRGQHLTIITLGAAKEITLLKQLSAMCQQKQGIRECKLGWIKSMEDLKCNCLIRKEMH